MAGKFVEEVKGASCPECGSPLFRVKEGSRWFYSCMKDPRHRYNSKRDLDLWEEKHAKLAAA